MATIDDVRGVIKLLIDAQLNYPPKDERIGSMAVVWVRLLGDIPGDVLEQAALDHIATAADFPKLSEIRALSEKVKARNGQSTAGGQFVKLDQPRAPFKGVYRTGSGTWEPVYRSEVPAREIPADPDIQPPDHPEFHSWQEAQAWQEAQRIPV
jgi:hypothetical protein